MIHPELNETIENEGNEKHFEYQGFQCHIRRVGVPYMGHLCGYITIPDGHRLYKLDYTDIEDLYQGELPAHGGLTFSDFVDDTWQIGFDCAHYGDLIPMRHDDQLDFRSDHDTYKTMDYVETNLKQIVEFLGRKGDGV
ncbi:hypothetical protein FQS90_12305 [Enterococcus casseliflavus]|uniref:hypothetical protein n=1 Tax=Enterococcus sp. 8E11_MSG4843 TaxID=1834190 RepID=UPI000B3ED20D|nr:hypothetical protein [Enterococcus sp. 8E11_MSG4843]MBO1097301.1 hypothetical protein [Enterococcus casseliflavus]MBO1144426.1 hypothetical protein [Enterococcus casseliflavus]OUZ36118.1 hypothetical protein A5885_000303 [Enterococcus sp. 8E11_MSG4843]